MKIEQKKWTPEGSWKTVTIEQLPKAPQLVFVFGARPVLQDKKHFEDIKAMYPSSHILSCSTSGEILGAEVTDGTIALTAVLFEKTEIKVSKTHIETSAESYAAGKKLAEDLPKEGLVHTMVFSEGLKVNGTSLVRGLTETLAKNISVTGGLAGDGDVFKETLVGIDSAPLSGNIALIGFYGNHLKIGYGSLGGWDTFGLERIITKSKENIVYEIDNKPALGLYKEYLGERATELPESGLFFPMSLRVTNADGTEADVARAFLAVNEKEQSMTFAGDMPEGAHVRLMKVNFERLIDGAEEAANMSIESLVSMKPDLAILVSCVARKLVLKERVEEEVEAVREVLGAQVIMTGFYSYGEISPTAVTEKQCQLHNQTMTITTFKEE